MKRKGIILAGGSGTRLYPVTKAISKQLLPVYDKPMIYYPLSVLMLAEIRNILVITTPNDITLFQRLLGDGSIFGLNITYEIQNKPKGIADAFIIGEKFIGNSSVCLILGDNIFYGQGFTPILKQASKQKNGATIFGYKVKNPEDFGIVEINKNNEIVSINEKPKKPKSNLAITGLYFYDNNVIKYAKEIKPSKRGELEITSINKKYLRDNLLKLEILGRGFAWLDTGTNENLLKASHFVETIESRQGYKVACLEEIGLKNNWINSKILEKNAKKINNSEYQKYLLSLVVKNN